MNVHVEGVSLQVLEGRKSRQVSDRLRLQGIPIVVLDSFGLDPILYHSHIVLLGPHYFACEFNAFVLLSIECVEVNEPSVDSHADSI